MKCILRVVTALAWVISARAATYYVDPVNGNDSNTGSLAAPWQSVTKPLNLPVPEGRTKAAAEEITVILQGGEYGALNLSDADGAAKAAGRGWITYRAAAGETPVFTGMNFNFAVRTSLKLRFIGIHIVSPRINGRAKTAQAGAVSSLQGVAEVVYKDMRFWGSGPTEGSGAVYVKDSGNLRYEHCEIGNNAVGMVFSRCQNVIISYNHIHHGCSSGIKYSFGNKNFVIEGNHIHDFPPYGGSHGSSISIRSGDVTIKKNIMHDGFNSSGMMLYDEGFTYNNITFENNLLYDIVNTYVMRLYNAGSNIVFKNNTFIGREYKLNYDPLYYGVAYTQHSGSGTPKLYNNLFIGRGSGSGSGNLFWDSGAWTKTGFFVDDPVFTPQHEQTLDYRLAAGSEGINYGDPANQATESLGTIGPDGFIQKNGVPRDATHHSVGAYEFGTGVTTIEKQTKDQLTVNNWQLTKGTVYNLAGRKVLSGNENLSGIYLSTDKEGRLIKLVRIK